MENRRQNTKTQSNNQGISKTVITDDDKILFFLLDVNGHCCVVKTELAAGTLKVQFESIRNRTSCLHVKSAV